MPNPSDTHPPAPIPRGVADYFWEEARRRRQLEATLLALFRSWGYGDVLPPAFEYEETLQERTNPQLQGELYRFVDRDGSMLSLRPDMTIQVARLVGTRLHDVPMPQRFCYAGSVYRYSEPRAGQQREYWQAGVELIGAPQPAADAEVLALTAQALALAGLDDVRLAVGHLGFFHALLAELALPPAAQELLLTSIDRNSDAALADFLRGTGLPDDRRTVVAGLPHLSGDDTAAVLQRARDLCLNDAMAAAVENLRAILDALENYGIGSRVYLDLTEIHNLGYYTGVTFEALSPRLGFPLAGGGRYDTLVGTFGPAQPAVGVALTIDRILLALRAGRNGSEQPVRPVAAHVLVAGAPGAACVKAAAQLRTLGLRVVHDLAGGDATVRPGDAEAMLACRDGAFQIQTPFASFSFAELPALLEWARAYPWREVLL